MKRQHADVLLPADPRDSSVSKGAGALGGPRESWATPQRDSVRGRMSRTNAMARRRRGIVGMLRQLATAVAGGDPNDGDEEIDLDKARLPPSSSAR